MTFLFRIYFRKWLCEAFTGILGKNLILYVWDLLFMYRWKKDIFKKARKKFIRGSQQMQYKES